MTSAPGAAAFFRDGAGLEVSRGCARQAIHGLVDMGVAMGAPVFVRMQRCVLFYEPRSGEVSISPVSQDGNT